MSSDKPTARSMLRPPETASDALTAMTVVMQRDLKSSFRQPQDLLNPLLFFIWWSCCFHWGSARK